MMRGRKSGVLNLGEIAVCTNLEFVGCGFVADDYCVGMHLKCAYGPGLSHRAFDSCLKGAGLAVAIAENEYLAGIHHSADTYCESMQGYAFGVASEEAGVGYAGVVGKGLYSCARCK